MNANQGALAIYEDEIDAIRDAVRALGGNKVVGHLLRPDLPADGGWLKDCLNPERREKLALSQIIKILRLAPDAGYHGPVQFICGEMGYSVQVIEPADEVAELQRAFVQSVSTQRSLIDRIERLTRTPLSQVK